MESFWRRLKYYGLGFLGGLIFVVVFFQNRGCSWLPGNRVKNSLLDRVIVVSESEEQRMQKIGVTVQDVKAALNQGDVQFTESKKNGQLKVYKIENEANKKQNIAFFFTMPEESFITEVHIGAPSAFQIRNTNRGNAKIIHLPNDKNLVYIDSSSRLNCQKRALKIKNAKEVLIALKKNGIIDLSKTKFGKRPKPTHVLSFYSPKNERRIYFEAVWYKNKIDITRFVDPTLINCQ